nr:class I adenylate-forming enzyme family protein [uncultured Rhodopila sp.]
MNITAPIRHTARLTPDAVAIVRADDSIITYGMLDRAIDRMAGHAANLGLRAGDVAGVAIQNETTPLILALGLARMGALSAEPSLPAEQMKLCFQFGQRANPGQVRFDDSWIEPAAGSKAASPRTIHGDPLALCRIFSSSGTTGTAKHIPVSHELMMRRVYSRWLCQGGGPLTRMIAVGLGIGWGFTTVLVTLWQGGTLVQFNRPEAVEAMRRHRVNVLVTSPSTLKTLAEMRPPGQGPLPDLMAIEAGGSNLPDLVRRAAADRLCRNVIVHAGACEAGGTASGPADALDGRPDAAGFVWPDVEMQAVSADHVPLPPGTEGILRVRSAMVAPGYYRDDVATAESFRDGWFYPGDIGTVWPDGVLCLNGRNADLINVGGDKISPQRIETGLLAIPGVSDAAAFGVPDGVGLTRVWAAITSGAPIEDAVLDAFCGTLPSHMAPQIVLQLEDLPRNENGKIRREALVDLALQLSQPARQAEPA